MTKFEVWEMLGGIIWLAALYLMWCSIGLVMLSVAMRAFGVPGK